MTTRRVRAALFDFGGVILSSPFEAFELYERQHDLPTGCIRRINATNPDSNAWALLERSEVDLDGFATLFEAEAADQGIDLDARAVIALLSGELRPAMVEAVRRCSQHLVTGLLTNNFVVVSGHVDREDDMKEVLGLFDAVVESSRIGVRKPDPRFYEIACDTLGIRCDEAVFLDDLGINLKPARALGMTTIKVVDPDEAIAELESVVGFDLR